MKSADRTLWLGVAGGFGLLLIAWAALFTVAAQNRVADVPLEHKTPASPHASDSGHPAR